MKTEKEAKKEDCEQITKKEKNEEETKEEIEKQKKHI